ncbi:uncharacterized protein LOC135534844 [Oncorhynchus masou masou]|uniref:uncharacterized protein LOC135534844 n=1 Tax=Oncorhynchus masou masou TaxID=90313 RepID=UPI003182F32D
MAHRLFEGKEHATSYWKYRVSPSAQLIEEVMSFLKKKRGVQPCDLAVDVGCGSGQGTVLLAPHFSSVVGTDISPAQLEVAQEHTTAPNISYRQCQAEELPFADSSVDLVTAMSAFHWFDRPRFLQEAHRILKAKGCLALLNYTMDMELDYGDCSHTLNTVCKEGGLLTDVSTLSIIDKVVMDRFLRALSHDMKRAVSLLAPQTLEGLLRAVETHQNTEALLKGSRAYSGTHPRGRKNTPTDVYPNRQSARPKGHRPVERRLGESRPVADVPR